MIVAAVVFVGVAVALHCYIFVMESLRWTAPATRRTFGLSADEAANTRDMAFNQGFYNLFLAVIATVGAVLVFTQRDVGAALIFAGCGSMVAAGVVLLLSSPTKARAALTQLATPLVAVVLLAAALIA
ncbi:MULTISPECIES: DUF1304 domain-containing protein [Gordonia]|uniref:Epimerase n=1 Tax=Gordonia sputi NBRC 100414 TaxID=1089453 RepID=H5TYH1_9ACTN|nr:MULTISPECIES: DUF1304 domain-containing protein [Gordonia]NKY92766.1 DUF1304 domain-containing protein [Gordonia sputi]OBA65137.1 epimerase [Gordonia sp. 852002-10350_SCH5691597]GAB38529.1 hypothetical protein GOSPT_045_01680 [Gordonia sputi NBRC 100414]